MGINSIIFRHGEQLLLTFLTFCSIIMSMENCVGDPHVFCGLQRPLTKKGFLPSERKRGIGRLAAKIPL